jgi:hypothetical protein
MPTVNQVLNGILRSYCLPSGSQLKEDKEDNQQMGKEVGRGLGRLSHTHRRCGN